MERSRRVRVSLSVCLFLSAPIVLAPGCREDKPSFEVITLEGKIERIDLAKNEISVLYYNEKQKAEVIGTGLVTEETEIMINGAVAKIGDLRPGDRVRGEVRVEKKGPQRKQVALKINVDRPKPVGGTGG